MIARLLVLLAALVLLLPVPAMATGGGEDDELGPQPARALALQALSILDQGASHELAMEKLELALASPDQEDVAVRPLREARAALDDEQTERAEALLRQVFPEDDQHVIGVTLRPHRGRPELIAAIVAAGFGVLGLAGLTRRRLVERRPTP